MKRLIALVVLATAPLAVSAQATKVSQPNVIFILADDLGYGDLGCYGQAKIKTPNLDRMASEGVRFRQAYSGSPLCGPSRSCLMTGQHTGHTWIRHNPSQAVGWDVDKLKKDPPLPDETLTFAKLFKQAGYSTAVIGKWGLGTPGEAGGPERLGFDYFFGYHSHRAAHEYYPTQLWRNDKEVANEGKKYSHELFTAEALQWVREHNGKPYALYLAWTIPHTPLNPPDNGDYEQTDWPAKEKALAAMITRMDGDVGKLMALLKELHLDDNTLVIFTSDNGGYQGGPVKPKFFDSTGGLRGSKGNPYEGGARVPLIARWPGKIKASESDALVAMWDWLPTFADLLGAKAPPDTDGISLLPALRGEDPRGHEFLYWELARTQGGFQELRTGNWKGERLNVSKGEPIMELYDLSSDPKQEANVANQHPDIVKKVAKLMDEQHTPSKMFPLTPAEGATVPIKGGNDKENSAE